jgi:hypothetical protein
LVAVAVGSVTPGTVGVSRELGVSVAAATAPRCDALGELVGPTAISLEGRNGLPSITANAAIARTTMPIPAGALGELHGPIDPGGPPTVPTGSDVAAPASAPRAPPAGSTVFALATDSGGGSAPAERPATAPAPTSPAATVPPVTPAAAAPKAPTVPTAPIAATPKTAPHSGHPSPASDQHQRHANTSHSGQWHMPTQGPIAAGSTDAPHRSQKGSGAWPGSRAPRVAGVTALPR